MFLCEIADQFGYYWKNNVYHISCVTNNGAIGILKMHLPILSILKPNSYIYLRQNSINEKSILTIYIDTHSDALLSFSENTARITAKQLFIKSGE